MLLVPISTDAPVYYFPYATVGLIVVNTAIFIAMASGAIDPASGWVMMHGDGIHPIQWITSMFAHADFGHLLSNMTFLWVFGLVVEGKLGWMRFLACYLAIGISESAFEQIVMLGYDGISGSLGASTAIYGIMAMAAVWAPKNEVTIFYWLFIIFLGTFDISIALLAIIYVSLDLIVLGFLGGQMSSSWLHVAGAAIGFPLGIAMYKRGVVDCEGWDMFHVWKGDYGAVAEREREDHEKAARLDEKMKVRQADQRIAAKEQFDSYLGSGAPLAAVKLCEKMKELGLPLELSEQDLAKLIRGLHGQNAWAVSAPFMAEILRYEPQAADAVRVKLAQICVVELNRPGRALDYLEQVDARSLPPKQLELARKVAAKANAMQQEGIVELDDAGWGPV